MKKDQIEIFEKVQTQLEALHTEISALSKKSQNDSLNKFKLKFVNQILVEANMVLGEQYKPFDDFDIFNDEDMPSNSDVAMMLSQYINCFEILRTENVTNDRSLHWYWLIDGEKSDIRSSKPLKLK